jgi:multidrug transporter EmrE-like cation transporter
VIFKTGAIRGSFSWYLIEVSLPNGQAVNSRAAKTPDGVRAIAGVIFLAAAYLLVLGGVMLISPGAVTMALGAPLLGGLELAGPYMFLMVAAVGAVLGWGLLRLNPWARRAVILVALLGVVDRVPAVSMAVVEVRAGPLIWGGLGVIVRTMIVWYLYQEPVAETFRR